MAVTKLIKTTLRSAEMLKNHMARNREVKQYVFVGEAIEEKIKRERSVKKSQRQG